MGSNHFQKEYIEYLLERNTELLNKMTHMKENYENKIFSKSLSKHYLITALEDMMNVCSALTQEIDMFFDQMTAAMGSLKNILLKKSEMVQLVDKVSHSMNPKRSISPELSSVEALNPLKKPQSEVKTPKKSEMVKVSPMINGHVISTEPRIYLSRISKELTPRRNETHQLSPIIEASPDPNINHSELGRHSFRELRIPLIRLNLNKLPHNFVNEESPKSRFKGPKTWKKSLSSQKRKSDNPKNEVCAEEKENEKAQAAKTAGDSKVDENLADPLEGPSWFYDENHYSSSSHPRGSNSYVDFRRRKHRFATVFDRNEDFSCEEVNDRNEQELIVTESKSPNKSGCANASNRSLRTSRSFSLKNSKDLSESLTADSGSGEENDDSEEVNSVNYGDCIEESSDESEYSQFKQNSMKKVSTPYSKNKKSCYDSDKSDSIYDGDNEEIPSAKKSSSKACRKSRSKSIIDGIKNLSERRCTPELTEETTKSPVSKKKSKIKRKKPSSKSQNKSQKQACVEIISYGVSNEIPCKRPKKLSSEKNTKTSDETIRKVSNISDDIPIVGRAKRKAAPKNLSEPKLGTKLRRE